MLFSRASAVAIVALFTAIAMTSLASVCCAQVVYGTTNSPNPVPLASSPIYLHGHGPEWVASGGCGCCSCGTGPSPLYVVDQGPTYTGPAS